jgi:hypothetical protein
MRKLLVVGVIFLFLGLACVPSINANVSKESELVEFTTEICGLGDGKHTVQLTKEEVKEVDRLFDSIRERLNETESREEAVEIFNEAIVELDKYGLLGGLSVKQAQRLVIGNWKIPIKQKIIDAIYYRLIGSANDFDNVNCLIYGRITNTLYFAYWAGMYILNWAKENGYEWIPAFWSCFLGFNFRLFPIKRASFMSIGSTRYNSWSRNEYYPSLGEIWTIGMEGVKEWNGSLKGTYYEFTYQSDFASWSMVGHIGVKLFRGLNFIKNDITRFFGFAREVKIGKWNP